nr:VOC family protein [Candidatus Freyarchaeota archaeon]
MKTNFHHIGIVVRDLKAAISKYCKALGVNSNAIKIHKQGYVTEKGEGEEFDYAFIPLGNNCYIELVSPISEGPTKRYLEKKGEGLFHLAFESDDILKTIENFEEAGFLLAGRTPSKQVLSVFFHPKSTHGVLLQVIKKNILLPDGSPNLELAMEEE